MSGGIGVDVSGIPGLRDLSPWWLGRVRCLWPDRVAVVDPDTDTQYTYADLQKRAETVASALLRSGVSHGDRVAAIMQNGVPLLDLLFACGRLGAILSPLNWRLSGREMTELLEDTDPTVAVVAQEFAGALPPMGTHVQVVDPAELYTGSRGELPPEWDDGMTPPVRMEDPWLILYTGGTTGTPKGALLTHGSILWNAINTVVSWGLSEADIGPSFTPMFHTGGWNVFTLPLLLMGGRVILPERFDPAAALDILEREKPTVMFLVPTMFQLIAEQPRFATADLSSLKWAISGGAPLPVPVLEQWKSKVRVFKQGYGLTEVGPNNFATPDAEAGRKGGSVGRLTVFASARIVDDDGCDVPAGTPGELLLAGPHMCAGYWRRPDATAAAIVDGWFHTGDVAICDDEGFYSIVDRKKDMIITGGENVYPTEVEAVLYGHPAVREAAVVGIPDPVWGEAVTAVVSLKPGMTAEPEELREYMRKELARYKVPKQVVIVESLPRSGAGKILRKEAKIFVEGNRTP